MSMVHVCDACGKVIQHPHDQKMRAFTLSISLLREQKCLDNPNSLSDRQSRSNT